MKMDEQIKAMREKIEAAAARSMAIVIPVISS